MKRERERQRDRETERETETEYPKSPLGKGQVYKMGKNNL
jgi:hypothetical protein